MPNSFNIPFKPSFFTFLGFSFSKFAPSGASTISPSELPAILLCYSELACTLIIIIILVFTILTAARERYKEDLYSIVEEVAESVAIIQNNFDAIFNMTLSDAEYILLSYDESLVNGLRKLRGLQELKSNEPKSPLLTEKTNQDEEGPNKANSGK